MRLDLFLKQTRLVKRRIVAKSLADSGHVFINDRPGKPASEVKNGDVLRIRIRGKDLVCKVNIIQEKNRETPSFEVVDDHRYEA